MQHVAGGVFGLIAGMFVETLLFITRVTIAEKGFELKDKAKQKAEQAILQSSTEPSAPLPAASAIVDTISEIQNQPESPSRVRKRRVLFQPSE